MFRPPPRAQSLSLQYQKLYSTDTRIMHKCKASDSALSPRRWRAKLGEVGQSKGSYRKPQRPISSPRMLLQLRQDCVLI